MRFEGKLEDLLGNVQSFGKQHTPYKPYVGGLRGVIQSLNEKVSPEKLYNRSYSKLKKYKGTGSKFSKYISNISNIVKYGTGALAAYSYFLIPYNMANGTASLESTIIYGGTTLALSTLTFHFNSIKNIFEKTHKKNNGEKLSKEEKHEVTRAGKIGRFTHLITPIIFAGSAFAYLGTYPILSPLVLFSSFGYLKIVHERYAALIEAADNYTTGKARKKFFNPVPVNNRRYPQPKNKKRKNKLVSI